MPPLPANGEDYSADLLVMLNLVDEDDPARSLVELLAVSITLHVEILNGEAAALVRRAADGAASSAGERNLRKDDAKLDVWH